MNTEKQGLPAPTEVEPLYQPGWHREGNFLYLIELTGKFERAGPLRYRPAVRNRHTIRINAMDANNADEADVIAEAVLQFCRDRKFGCK